MREQNLTICSKMILSHFNANVRKTDTHHILEMPCQGFCEMSQGSATKNPHTRTLSGDDPLRGESETAMTGRPAHRQADSKKGQAKAKVSVKK